MRGESTGQLTISGRPFPVKAGRLDDGTGLDAGFVPYWAALLAHNQYMKVANVRGLVNVPTLEQIERQGGFDPIVFWDLLAGGDGSGRAAYMIATRKLPSLVADLPLGQVIKANGSKQ